MRMVDLIQIKRDGGTHTSEQLQWIIQHYAQGQIPDEQMSAWAMAVYFRGMNQAEMAELTMQMAASGEQVEWDAMQLPGPIVDKHSTGGVGDKLTLIVAPWAAACGLFLGKMSGRGLGHTGGTLDKLESIPGFQIDLGIERFQKQVKDIGMALISQSKQLTPADAKLYALRDVTATVPSIPLIASSIMSKKIAAGAKAIVLDVKVGHGAFMKTKEDAIKLAMAMVQIGEELGRETIAMLTAMDQPLGRCIGNALEVQEAIEVLKGNGSNEMTKLAQTFVCALLRAAHVTQDDQAALELSKQRLQDGSAWRVFDQWITAQGGALDAFLAGGASIQAPIVKEVLAIQDGYLVDIQAESVGLAAMRLGAGRAKKTDVIDHRVGIELFVKTGQFVSRGTIIAKMHGADENTLMREEANFCAALTWSEQAQDGLPLLIARVDKNGIEWF